MARVSTFGKSSRGRAFFASMCTVLPCIAQQLDSACGCLALIGQSFSSAWNRGIDFAHLQGLLDGFNDAVDLCHPCRMA